MALQTFLDKNNGKYVEVAGTSNATNQCVDLANLYIRDVLGLPIIEWTNAVDFPSKAGDKYDYILNTLTNVPQEGDLIVWATNHIAIFVEGNANSFKSFDQNYPLGSPCHIQGHTYANVKGWLHPKSIDHSTDPLSTIDFIYQGKIDISNSVKQDHFAQFMGFANWQAYQDSLNKPINELIGNLAASHANNAQQITVMNSLQKQLTECQNKPPVSTATASTASPLKASTTATTNTNDTLTFSQLWQGLKDLILK